MDTLELKIGRHTYTITSEDEFMDNGACVQLLTQSKEPANWGSRPDPTLSKKAVKVLTGLCCINHDHDYGPKVRIFSIESGS